MGERIRFASVRVPVQGAPGSMTSGQIGIGENAAGLLAINLLHADGTTLTALLSEAALERLAHAIAAVVERRNVVEAAAVVATLQ